MNKVSKCVLAAACLSFATVSMADLARTSTMSQSQMKAEIDNFKNVVQLNIFTSLIGYANVTFNHRLNKSSTAGINVGYWSFDDDDGDSGSISNVKLVYSRALNGDVMSSGWLAKPFIGVVNSDFTINGVDDDDSDGSGVAAGVTFTYQWMWTSGVNIQLGLGPQFSTVYAGTNKSKTSLNAEFLLGYAF